MVSCLSSNSTSSGLSNVYAGDSYMDLAWLPPSCQMMKTVSYPYFYDAFDSMVSNNEIILYWYFMPGCEFCYNCGFKNSSSNETQCFDVPPPFYPIHSKSAGISTKDIIIGVCAGVFILAFSIVIIVGDCCFNKKKETENQTIMVENFLAGYKSLKPTRYSYAETKQISNQFKSKLGEGGYGSVFKGMLPNGTPVAVKILKSSSNSIDAGGDFINEVGTIGTIHHVNVVRLLGFCADGYKRALIYEFMPNESLAKFIFSKGGQDPSANLLGWEKLKEIAVGIARGIQYLHQGCEQRILHFDIKPHNILLDQNFIPKISDFGLAKLCSKEKSIVSMTAARGTLGYIAPELMTRNFGNVSYKSDVYSFGMLLIEMVGGRKNNDPTVENSSQVYFPEWVYNQLSGGGDGLRLRVVGEEDAEIARRLTTVAMWCIQWYPVDRPSMKSVVQMLEGDMVNLEMPPDPFTSVSMGDVANGVADLSAKSLGTNLTTISEEVEVEQEVSFS